MKTQEVLGEVHLDSGRKQLISFKKSLRCHQLHPALLSSTVRTAQGRAISNTSVCLQVMQRAPGFQLLRVATHPGWALMMQLSSMVHTLVSN